MRSQLLQQVFRHRMRCIWATNTAHLAQALARCQADDRILRLDTTDTQVYHQRQPMRACWGAVGVPQDQQQRRRHVAGYGNALIVWQSRERRSQDLVHPEYGADITSL